MAKLCPKCNSELEELRACGAVNYFCNSCNELVSKRSVIDTEKAEEENKEEQTKSEKPSAGA
ncbi:zinc-ribbon domain-containing protein [Reinekea marinisedimentorum]|uniref:Zinc ribbon protein n=1 Tax=Reinekea marinisedimentorum TaxID=230495 RepID=A0A4R3IDH1_9GAMM|nr:zinc-ribbon domain-containing protein [Reinekea marinisedimentorum]TCS43787.1 zinc ribbon protein [Reinekea marinisedimentorum]